MRGTCGCGSCRIQTLAERPREVDRRAHTPFDRLHQRAPDNNAVGHAPHRYRVLRTRDTKSHGDRKRRRRAQPGDSRRELGRQIRTGARHPEAADQIHESAAVPGDIRHPRIGGGGRNQADERERPFAQPRLADGIGTNREVGHQQPLAPASAARCRRVGARGQQRIQVAEDQDRHSQAGSADQSERPIEVIPPYSARWELA